MPCTCAAQDPGGCYNLAAYAVQSENRMWQLCRSFLVKTTSGGCRMQGGSFRWRAGSITSRVSPSENAIDQRCCMQACIMGVAGSGQILHQSLDVLHLHSRWHQATVSVRVDVTMLVHAGRHCGGGGCGQGQVLLHHQGPRGH